LEQWKKGEKAKSPRSVIYLIEKIANQFEDEVK
jgi:hypothetical protein